MNPEALVRPEQDIGVPHGDLLLAFAEAIIGTDRAALDTARTALAELIRLYQAGQRYPLMFHPDLADTYNPAQDKAFENLSFRFRAGDYREHHLMHDASFGLLLGPASAPLGEQAATSPFIEAIEAVTATMNQALVSRPVDPTDASEALS